MIYIILTMVISLLVALFAVQNAMIVEVKFLSFTFVTNLVMVILSSLLAGIFITLIWTLKMKAAHFLKDKKVQDGITLLELKNQKLEEEIAMLKHTQLARCENKAKIGDKSSVDGNI